MRENEITKCTECNSRSIERDEQLGEVVCKDCGLVLADNVIDDLHESGRVGEGAHNSPMRNDSRNSKYRARTRTGWGEKYDGSAKNQSRDARLYRAEKYNTRNRKTRLQEIREKILELTGAEYIARAADPFLKGCFDKDGENLENCGPLPLNQMRFMNATDGDEAPADSGASDDGDSNSDGGPGNDSNSDGQAGDDSNGDGEGTGDGTIIKDSNYVINVCAIAIMRVLAFHGKMPYRFWKEDAKRLGLEPADINTAVKHIVLRMRRLFKEQHTSVNPNEGIAYGRKRMLEAFEERLGYYVRKLKIEGGHELLIWVRSRISTLYDGGKGPLGNENPDMLVAMVSLVGIRKFGIKGLTKKFTTEKIFLLSQGGVNSRMKHKPFKDYTLQWLIENFKSDDDSATGES